MVFVCPKAPYPLRDGSPFPPNGLHEKSYEQQQSEILERRLAEEKAHYERGFPVAGHDFRREHEERERERERER